MSTDGSALMAQDTSSENGDPEANEGQVQEEEYRMRVMRCEEFERGVPSVSFGFRKQASKRSKSDEVRGETGRESEACECISSETPCNGNHCLSGCPPGCRGDVVETGARGEVVSNLAGWRVET